MVCCKHDKSIVGLFLNCNGVHLWWATLRTLPIQPWIARKANEPPSSIGIKNSNCLLVLSFQPPPVRTNRRSVHFSSSLVLIVSLFLHHVSSLSLRYPFIYNMSMDFHLSLLLSLSFPPLFSLLTGFLLPPPCEIQNHLEKKKFIHQSIHGFCREGLHCQNPDWISSLRPTIWRFLLEPSDEWRRQNCCLRFELKQLFDKYISSVTINPSSCKFHLISILKYNLISSFAYLYWLIFVVVVVVIWVFGSWIFFFIYWILHFVCIVFEVGYM